MMLVFLFLTLLFGVCQSEIVGNEEEGVTGVELDQMELQNSRMKRTFLCGTFCDFFGGTCLAEGQSTADCAFTITYSCFSSPSCICCYGCGAPTSLCELSGGTCKKKGTCDMKEFENNSILKLCKYPLTCSCCENCTTPSSCPDDDGMAVCVGDEVAATNDPALFKHPTGTCKAGENCKCFNKCLMKDACEELGGNCIQKDEDCQTDFLKFKCGCKDDANCRCCVPKRKKKQAKKKLGCGVDKS